MFMIIWPLVSFVFLIVSIISYILFKLLLFLRIYRITIIVFSIAPSTSLFNSYELMTNQDRHSFLLRTVIIFVTVSILYLLSNPFSMGFNLSCLPTRIPVQEYSYLSMCSNRCPSHQLQVSDVRHMKGMLFPAATKNKTDLELFSTGLLLLLSPCPR